MYHAMEPLQSHFQDTAQPAVSRETESNTRHYKHLPKHHNWLEFPKRLTMHTSWWI